jgi:hypothetical protein
MLEPRHVGPRDFRDFLTDAGGNGIEVRRSRAPREQLQHDPQEKTPSAIEEIGVVEVHVHERGRLVSKQIPGEITERVRRRQGAEGVARGEPNAGGVSERRPGRAARKVGRLRRARSAVDVTELGTRFGDLHVRVPAATAEGGRSESEFTEAAPLDEHALARAVRRRARVVGRGPVRVVAERSP